LIDLVNKLENNSIYQEEYLAMAKHKKREREREIERRRRRRKKCMKLRAKGLLPPPEESKKA